MRGVRGTEKFVPIIMAAVFALIAFVLYRIAVFTSSFIARRKITAVPRLSKDAVQAVLCSYFGVKYVLTDVVLPHYEVNGRTFVKADAVVILNSGIAVISVSTAYGKIANGLSDTWYSNYKKDGIPLETSFRNPIPYNNLCTEALLQAFARKKTSSPELYGLVIFSTDRVSFTDEYDEIFALNQGFAKLKKLNRAKLVSRRERSAYLKLIKGVSASAKRESRKRV